MGWRRVDDSIVPSYDQGTRKPGPKLAHFETAGTMLYAGNFPCISPMRRLGIPVRKAKEGDMTLFGRQHHVHAAIPGISVTRSRGN